MSSYETLVTAESTDFIQKLQELRRCSDAPTEFWRQLLDGIAHLFAAHNGLLLLQNNPGEWQLMLRWPDNDNPLQAQQELNCKLAQGAFESGFAWDIINDSGKEHLLVAGHMQAGQGQPESVIILQIDDDPTKGLEQIELQFRLLADIPVFYQLNRLTGQHDGAHVLHALDLMVLLHQDNHFVQGCMTVCNQIAAQQNCDRVSIGWLHNGYIKLQAISHMQKFDRKMVVIEESEAVMEEALEQEKEVLYPRPEGDFTVAHQHELYAHSQHVDTLLSLPLFNQGVAVAVITCERHKSFESAEVQGLRMVCDLSSRPLSDLYLNHGWFGHRWAVRSRQWMSQWLGFEYSFNKTLIMGVFGILLYLIFGSWNYHVEAPFLVRTDKLAFVPAPFDGYIDTANVEIGDTVTQSEILLRLDSSELELQESDAMADYSRYSREEEKARAANDLAEMKIGSALKAQSVARLKQIRYRLQHAQVKAPIDGVVVEGELKKLQGAPIQKGEVLFKVASLDGLYLELNINENDIHEIKPDAVGKVSFVARPDDTYSFNVKRIHPQAVVKNEANSFTAEADFSAQYQHWWRPGMSGVAHIEVGQRTPLWVLTHRTVDFLRMFFWW